MPEAQNGRIGGGVLKDNLERQGVNLNITNVQADITSNTPLLHLNVNTAKVGIRTNSPGSGDDLFVNNTVSSTNLLASNFDVANYNISNSAITANSGNILLSSAGNIFATSLATDDLKIDFNTISTTTPNTNVELRPDGSGNINIRSNWNITGNLHATGDITMDGNITFGSDDQDDVVFASDVNSDIIPDVSNTASLGRFQKQWLNIYSNLLNGQQLDIGAIEVNGSGLSRRQGNIFYVSTLGDDTNVGDHQHGAFRTLKHALDVVDSSSGGPVVIHVYPGVYEEELPLTIPPNTSVQGENLRNTIIKPAVGYESEDVFYVEGNTTISDLTIKDFFYDSINDKGYAFRFTPGGVVNERSPYIQNVTVLTQGSVTSVSDPRGFASGDAGKGALIDGNDLDTGTIEGSMLFHSATFITPGVDTITLTNGVRVEWLNSFTYFANRGLYATQGVNGLGGNGVRFGAEVRSINSANIYGNYGAIADGADTLMYLIGHNFAYIGTGKDSENDLSLILQDQETVELNSGKIYYVTTDQQGTFRIGDSFFANFIDGTTSFDIGGVNLQDVSAIYINDGGNITYIDGEFIRTGKIVIGGNTITTSGGDLIFSPDSEYFDLENNPALIISRGTDLDRNNIEADFRYNTGTNLFEGFSTGNLSFGGTYSSDRDTSIDAHDTNNTIVLRVSNTQVGTFNNLGVNLHGLSTGDVLFDNNLITTTLSNSDLELKRPVGNDLIVDDFFIKNRNFYNTTNNQLVVEATGQGYIKFNATTGLVVPTGGTAYRGPLFSVAGYSPAAPISITIDASGFAPVAGSWVSGGTVTSNGQARTVTNAVYDSLTETLVITLNISFSTPPSIGDVVSVTDLVFDDVNSTNLFLPQIGETRYNSDEFYMETWNGTAWQRSAGEGAEVTDEVLKELVDLYTLVLG